MRLRTTALHQLQQPRPLDGVSDHKLGLKTIPFYSLSVLEARSQSQGVSEAGGGGRGGAWLTPSCGSRRFSQCPGPTSILDASLCPRAHVAISAPICDLCPPLLKSLWSHSEPTG